MTRVTWVIISLIAMSLILGFMSLADHETRCPPPPSPVCHAVTEDSVIHDCDYRDGGWYPRGS